jgi:hypothetical protein
MMLVLIVAAVPPLFFSSWNFGLLMETSPHLLVPTFKSYRPSYGHSTKIALIDDRSLVTYSQNVPSSLRGAVRLTTIPSMTPPPFPPFNVGDFF